MHTEYSSVSFKFISGVPKVQQLPIVFPLRDERQFHRLLSKKARRSLKSRRLGGRGELPVVAGIKQEVGRFEEEEPSTSTANRPQPAVSDSLEGVSAGETLKRMRDESDGSMMFFQLPSTLSPLFNSRKNDSSPRLVGKLQFLRSGRVVMKCGGRTIDVLKTATNGGYEVG